MDVHDLAVDDEAIEAHAETSEREEDAGGLGSSFGTFVRE